MVARTRTTRVAAVRTDVTAYTAVGSYVSGQTKALDFVELSR